MNKRKDILRRTLLTTIGLILFSIGDFLYIKADIGLTCWGSLSMGLTNFLPLTYGQTSIIISIIIIIIDLLMKEKIGLGTILDAIICGACVDLWVKIIPFNVSNNLFLSILLIVIGLFINAYATYLYMSGAISCGPRDLLLVACGKRLSKFQIGTVDRMMKIVLIIIDLIIGGPIGIGTLITMVGYGISLDIVNKLLKFEPRDIKHESIDETIINFIKG